MSSRREATGAHRPNIIVLTVDTLRADHMSLYGYARDTMPVIEAFAKTAAVFDNAVVPRGVTGPSYASILTGLYPFRSGVRTNGTVLHADLTTLPEILKTAGYHTAGFISNSVLIDELSGMGQGFDVYDDQLDERESKRFNYERTAANTLRAILAWLNGDPPQPFFLFTNFIDPHGPYDPPKKYRTLYRSTRTRILKHDDIRPYMYVPGQLNYYDYVDRYDAEIRYVGAALRLLIDELKRRGIWDDALVVFTADHGESMGEHGLYFRHHYFVWEETMHVPLVIRLPGWAKGRTKRGRLKRIGNVCSPMDLAPTVLDYLDLSCDVAFDGRSLLPLLDAPKEDDRTILLEFPSLASPPPPELPDMYAVRSATHKLIELLDQDTGKVLEKAVYRVASDPLEKSSVPFDPENPMHRMLDERLRSMLSELHTYKLPFTLTVYEVPYLERGELFVKRHQHGKTIRKKLPKEQAERLRGLGYIP